MGNETLTIIKSLRTIHWDFNEKQVSNENIETIIEHSMKCANSDNLIDYSIIIVDDPKTLNFISGGESGGKRLKCLIYCLDYTRIIKSAQTLGYTEYQPANSLYDFNIAMYDIMGAAQTAVIAAKSMGIDSLVTNFIHRYHPQETMELLNLPPEYCVPIIQIVLGYSDKDINKTMGRLSKEHIIHYGKYNPDIKTEEIIKEMDGIYPNYISEKYHHALDWYFNEWLIEFYDEKTYKALLNVFDESKILFKK